MRGLALALMLVCCGSAAAVAQNCPVPDDLVMPPVALPAAHAAMARAGKLVVMTLGGAAVSASAAGDAAASTSAQLRAALASGLPGATIEMVTRVTVGHGAAYIARNLPAWLAETRPALVIWGPGAREMARVADPDRFAEALEAAVDAIHQAGADLLLLDLQYAPSIARVANSEPYRRVLRGAADARDIALVPRYDLMMAWNDTGVLDLDAQDPATRRDVARRLFGCMAAVLAPVIIQGLR